MTDFPAPSLKNRALRLLTRRDYTRAELIRRLSGADVDADELNAVLDALERDGWLSDARAAESLLRRRGARLGGARVLHELREKGVGGDLLEQAAQTLRGSELERAQAVWRRKFGVPPADAKERARQLRFLAGRGFSGEVAYRVLRAAGDGDDGQ